MSNGASLPNPMQLKEFLESAKTGKWVDKEEVVQKVCNLIRTSSLTQKQVDDLRRAVESRIIWKTCYKCGKNKEQYRGRYEAVTGDLSNKRFVCASC